MSARRAGGLVRACLVALLLLAAPHLATGALAHASLIGSDPRDGAVVMAAPGRVTLTFNEPVSALLLRVIVPDGQSRDLAGVAVDGNVLQVSLPPGLGRGTHLLSWRVVSADGHPVGGSLVFSIGEPSLAPQELAREQAGRFRQGAIWTARLALYLGLLFGCGGAFHAAFIARPPRQGASRRLLATLLATGCAGAVVSTGLQGADAYDMPVGHLHDIALWREGLATSHGSAVIAALIAMAAAGLSLRLSNGSRLFAILGLLGSGLAFAASGHASAAEPQLLTRPMVFAHGVAVTFWLGSLGPLAASLSRGSSAGAELQVFSRLIPWAVAALALSGVILAAVQLREPATLWTTTYGWLLAAKLALVLLLLVIAATNRLALTPSVVAGDDRSTRAMRRNIAVEIALALVILAVVASWRFTPPPRSLLAAAAVPVHAHVHGGAAMASLAVDAPVDGARMIHITLLDPAFGPLTAQEVTVFLSRPEAGIERLRLPARHIEETIWRVPNVRLPAGGAWGVRIE